MLERFLFYVRHSFNDLKVNRQRTLFALLCIGAGVAAIVSLQTLAVMMNNTLTGSLQESNRGDIRISPSFAFEEDEDDERGSGQGQPDTGTDIDRGIEEGILVESDGAFEGVTQISPQGLEALETWFAENTDGATLTYRQQPISFDSATSIAIPERDTDAIFIQNYFIESDLYPLYGEIESEEDESLDELLNEPTDIVISRNLADDLGAEVGDRVRVSGASEDFVLRGIIPTREESGFQNFLGNLTGYFFLDVRSVALFDDMEPQVATEVYVQLENPDEVDEVATALVEDYPYLNTTTTTDLEETNEQISSTVDDLVVIMGLVSLLIGGIGIVNTMLVIVSRRTTEIAVLKTIGLEPEEITILFLVEAIIMGVIGSILGIFAGWGAAFATKGVAETFLGQSLTFTIALDPVINGFVVGVIITAIFGFLPTLAAGQVRPATVLRPSETVIPRAGRFSAFVAVVALIMALSLVAQGLLGDLLDELGNLTLIVSIIGFVYGVAMAIPLVISSYLSLRENRRGRSWAIHAFQWAGFLVVLPVLGILFARAVPAILVLTGTVVIVGYLYILLWLMIWAVGGGRIGEIWPGILILAFPLFWPLIPLIIALVTPLWVLGWLIQRYTFVDLKIAMRSMLSSKGRGASTLVALVVGVFTLSIITMLVDSINSAFAELLEDEIGGNVLIFAAGSEGTVEDIEAALSKEDNGVKSFSLVNSFNTQLVKYRDESTGESLTLEQLQARIDNVDTRDDLPDLFSGVDGRGLQANLPEVGFAEGRNLDPARDSQPDEAGIWPVVIYGDPVVDAAGIEVGDLMVLAVNEDANDTVTLRVVGITQATGIEAANSPLYAPRDAFSGMSSEGVFAVADVDEDRIPDLRRDVNEISGAFLLETRLLNDLINRIIEQFTSFPTLVAALALTVGGVVIANSVALSTMERRREIGIMKAVGLQRERVLGMLLMENGLMGIVGGLIGVGISFVGLVILLAQIFDDELGSVIPYQTAFLLMGLCIVISLVAAVLSVWGASGEKPLNVLRYE